MSDIAALADGVAGILARTHGIDVTAGSARQLTGGASRETWAVDVTSSGLLAPTVVLRRDPPGHGEPDRMRAEATCLRAAADAGVPVPALLAAGDDAPGIDAPYLVTELVPGEALARKIQRNNEFDEVRPLLARDMGRVLGLIHRTPTSDLDGLSREDPLESLERLHRGFDDPRPVVEAALRWLYDHRPPRRADALVHGDFRLGNLLIDGGGITGVLDWELAHIGDPLEDLGWLCVRAWRFGAPLPVAGVGHREDLLDGYESVTGVRPDAQELLWWEIFGTLRWLVISQLQAHRHLSGDEHSLELAAVGRRVCESEYDLLLVLDLLDDSAVPPSGRTGTDADSLHDRPSVEEILALVSETMAGDVLDALPADRGRERYLVKICLNLLGMVGRELDAADAPHVRQALTAAGVDDERALAQAIRSGTATAADPTVRQAISAAVLERLRVANPRHLIER